MTELDFERYFNRFGRDIQSFMDRLTHEETSGFNPVADISEDEKNIRIEVDLPGMSKQDISISYADDILTVKGTRKIESDENQHYVRKERLIGSFSRSFPVPGDIENSAIKATFKEGVLTITLPKSEEKSNSSSIPIN